MSGHLSGKTEKHSPYHQQITSLNHFKLFRSNCYISLIWVFFFLKNLNKLCSLYDNRTSHTFSTRSYITEADLGLMIYYNIQMLSENLSLMRCFSACMPSGRYIFHILTWPYVYDIFFLLFFVNVCFSCQA